VRGYEREQDEQFPPLFVKKIYSYGEPVAYGVPSVLDELLPEEQTVWESLPEGELPRSEIKKAYGGSSESKIDKFIKDCQTHNLLRKLPGHGRYTKVRPATAVMKANGPAYIFRPKTWLEEFIWERLGAKQQYVRRLHHTETQEPPRVSW